jgi:hypothetical protein
MNLFDNAVDSIRLGVEDFHSNDTARHLSAARNFYAGVLLLAKDILIQSVPKADPKAVISAKYKPVPDNQGGMTIEPDGSQTIDVSMLSRRFKEFGLTIDDQPLNRLQKIRNDIEHHTTTEPKEAVRAAIANTFSVVAQLFKLAGKDPATALGDTWQEMLKVSELYEAELTEARATFSNVQWFRDFLEDMSFVCTECNSELVAQKAPENTDPQSIDCKCRGCGHEMKGEEAFEHGLDSLLETDGHQRAMDGEPPIIGTCPECSIEAYVDDGEETGCAWCGEELGECSVCSEGLTSRNVAWDTNSMCAYCAHRLAKDD